MAGSNTNPHNNPSRPGWGAILAGVAAIATTIGVVWGIYWGIFTYHHPNPGNPTTSTNLGTPTIPDTRTQASATSGTPDATSHPSTVGTCLTTGQAVACTNSHTQEITPASACTSTGLMSYLGGSPDVDVLRSTITLTTTATTCTVTLPEPITIPLADALAQPSSAVLRRCYTTTTATPREIGCANPHNTEAIRLYPAHSTTPITCDSAAVTYLGLPQDQWSDALVTTNHTLNSGTTECVIGPRSDSVLTTTLRNIRNNTLPLAPA